MAKIIFKLNNRPIELEGLPDRALRDSFSGLRDAILARLSGLSCPMHRIEPTVILTSDGQKVALTGFGACCRDFLGDVHKSLEPLPIVLDSDYTVTIREYSYPSRG